MSDERLLEKLLNCKQGQYSKLLKHDLTMDDIEDFKTLYQEFALLQKDYSKLLFGRKEAAKGLVKKLKLLEEMSRLIQRGTEKQRRYYEDFTQDLKDTGIRDYNKAFEVLKKLASNGAVQYEIKTIQYSTFDSSERHGYRETTEYTGEIMILAEKELLSQNFDDSENQIYSIKLKTENIYKQGSSVIIAGNDEHLTLPTRLGLPNGQVIGYFPSIALYLQKDELATAASSFISFLEENGTDLDKIDVDDLVQAIRKKYQKTKKLV